MPHCLHTLPLYVDINGGRGRYIYLKAKYLSEIFLDFTSIYSKVFYTVNYENSDISIHSNMTEMTSK